MKRQISIAASAFIGLCAAVWAAPQAAKDSLPPSAAKTHLSALEGACRRGDERGIVQSIGDLRAEWGNVPDYGAIGEAVLSRDADPKYRWVMLDSLVQYKRIVKDSRDARALLTLLDVVSWAENDTSFVRAKALTVEAGMIALFEEKGLIREARRREFGKKLAALIEKEKDGDLLAAACIAAGSADAGEAVPALRKHVRNENAPSLVRRTAAGSLGKLKDRESIPLIAEVMKNTTDRALYGSSAFALGTMGGEEVVEPLVAHAGRFDTHSCGNALRRNSATVARMLTDTQSPRLENAIRAAGLAEMKETLPQLEALEKDGRPEVRRAAKEARERISRKPGGATPGADARREVKP